MEWTLVKKIVAMGFFTLSMIIVGLYINNKKIIDMYDFGSGEVLQSAQEFEQIPKELPEENPKTVQEKIERIKILYQNNKVEETEALFSEIIQHAQSLEENGKIEESLAIYEELLGQGLGSIEIVTKVYAENLSLGNFDKALKAYLLLAEITHYDEIFVGGEVKQDNLTRRLEEKYAFLQGAKENLDKLYLEIAQLQYDIGDYYYGLDAKKYSNVVIFNNLIALNLVNKAIENNPNNSDAYALKGRILGDLSAYDLAEKEMKKAISLKGDDFMYYYRLGNIYRDQDKYELARDAFIKGIELNGNYEKLHLNLGNAYFELGEREKSDQSYYNGIKVCSVMCTDFYYNLGYHLYQDRKNEEALSMIQKSIDTQSTINPKSYYLKGELLYNFGEYEESIKSFKVALEQNYFSADSLFFIGENYLAQGKFDEAKSYFEKSLEIDPNFYSSRYRLGEIKKEVYGDYVHLVEGKFIFIKNYIKAQKGILGFEFNVEFNSRIGYNGPTGMNWIDNYNYYLTEEDNGNMLFFKNGGTFRFIKEGDVYSYNLGIPGTLKYNEGVYKLVNDKEGKTYYFESLNKDFPKKKNLVKITDTKGGELVLKYASNNLLSEVIDKNSRKSYYTYYDHNRLKEVNVYNGEKILFEYYLSNSELGLDKNLKKITHKKGDQILSETTFEYSGNRDMTRIYTGTGNLYLTNSYDSDSYIVKQDYGDGKIIQYIYEPTQNVVIDENGFKTIHRFNDVGLEEETIYHTPSGEISHIIKSEYNENGQIIKKYTLRGSDFAGFSDQYEYNSIGGLAYQKGMEVSPSSILEKEVFVRSQENISIEGIFLDNMASINEPTILNPLEITTKGFKLKFKSSFFDPAKHLQHEYGGYQKISKLNLYYNNGDGNDILVGYGLPFVDFRGNSTQNFGNGEIFIAGYQGTGETFFTSIEPLSQFGHKNLGELFPANKNINIKIGVVDHYGNEYISDNFAIKIVE